MRVTRHLYDAPGFGVGELWVRGETVIQHELASEALRLRSRRSPDGRDAAEDARQGGRSATDLVGDGEGRRGHGDGTGPAAPKPSLVSPDGGARLPARNLPGEVSQVCASFVPDLCRRFVSHLAGIPTGYDGLRLDLDWATPLQRELAAATRAIPWGEVVSYGELAALAGAPRAARAAGSFCAENRFSLIIPCHRVVAANGIGGYGAAGPELKRQLLALEGVSL